MNDGAHGPLVSCRIEPFVRHLLISTNWATGFSVKDEEYVFSGLIDASPDEQAELDVVGRAPFGDPHRVDVVVARLPLALVESVWTAD